MSSLVERFKLFFIGCFISLCGTFPFGTLNVLALHISANKGIYSAFLFSVGVALTEMAYVYITLIGLRVIQARSRLLYTTQWLSVGILLVFAFLSAWSALYPLPQQHAILLPEHLSPFLLGLLMSSVNPAQITFWLGWNSVLIAKNILKYNIQFYFIYILGIGLGTLSGLAFFIGAGQFGVGWIQAHQNLFNYIIAGVFLCLSIFQGYGLITRRHQLPSKLGSIDTD